MDFKETIGKMDIYTLYVGKEYPGINFPIEKMLTFPHDMYNVLREGRHAKQISEVLKIEVSPEGVEAANNIEAKHYLDNLLREHGYTPRWNIVEGEDKGEKEYIPLTEAEVLQVEENRKNNEKDKLAIDFSQMNLSKF